MLGSNIIAITGPSGSGKTTLGNKLKMIEGIDEPFHCTTREKRIDDDPFFYRYLSHQDYANLYYQNKFLISSGDSSIIKKENGNFYGVLFEDCNEKWKYNDILVLLVSYKDIERLLYLKTKGYFINIVNLTFEDIENGVETRLNSSNRNCSKLQIYKRIQCALKYEKEFGEFVKENSDCVIYSDKIGIDETFENVCNKLTLINKKI